MAAPPSKTINNLNGSWYMNKDLSSSPDPALALQGIGWLTRKAIGLASVTLHVKHYKGAPTPPAEVVHIDIDQTATGGVKGSTELRCLDYVFREHSDWLFGTVRGQSKFVKASEIEDAFLAKGWLEEGEETVEGGDGETHVFSRAVSDAGGWTGTQVWGFKMVNGERRHCRNLVVEKDGKRVEMEFVYDFLGEKS